MLCFCELVMWLRSTGALCVSDVYGDILSNGLQRVCFIWLQGWKILHLFSACFCRRLQCIDTVGWVILHQQSQRLPLVCLQPCIIWSRLTVWHVYLYVCRLSVVHPAKAVGRNEMPFGRNTRVVSGNTVLVLDRGPGHPWKERFGGRKLPPVCSYATYFQITLALVIITVWLFL